MIKLSKLYTNELFVNLWWAVTSWAIFIGILSAVYAATAVSGFSTFNFNNKIILTLIYACLISIIGVTVPLFAWMIDSLNKMIDN